MAKPNNIYKSSIRKLILSKEETKSTYTEALKLKNEWELTKEYYMVRMTRFKFGSKPSKYNGFKQSYQYAIRAYNKQY